MWSKRGDAPEKPLSNEVAVFDIAKISKKLRSHAVSGDVPSGALDDELLRMWGSCWIEGADSAEVGPPQGAACSSMRE